MSTELGSNKTEEEKSPTKPVKKVLRYTWYPCPFLGVDQEVMMHESLSPECLSFPLLQSREIPFQFRSLAFARLQREHWQAYLAMTFYR